MTINCGVTVCILCIFCALFLEHIRVPIVVFYNWNQKVEGIRVQKMSLIHNLNVFELIFSIFFVKNV